MNSTSQKPTDTKWIVFALLVIIVGALWFQFRDVLTLDYLAQRENDLRHLYNSSPFLVFGLAFLLYVTVTGLALPGATVLSLSYAWFFGFWPALILISFASTLGATISFLLSRFLFRDAILHRFGDRLKTINENLETEGMFYLFTLRLIPAFPFFVVNLVMGLTPMKTWPFWWISQVGMLPGTIAYVFAGSSVPGIKELQAKGASSIVSIEVLIAFAILGVFPFVARKVIKFVSALPEEKKKP